MASVWCAKCGKSTMHSVFDGRRGACLDCLEKLNAIPAKAKVGELHT
jgi:hypothetical protein